MKWRLLLICALCFGLSVQPAFATRYLQTKNGMANSAGEETPPEDVSGKYVFDSNRDYGNIYYADDVPGVRTETAAAQSSSDDFSDLFAGYYFNGEQINVPDFSSYSSFAPNRITNFSDAIVDFIGWDAMLGAVTPDKEEKVLDFQVSYTDNVLERSFSYTNRLFGMETVEFDIMVEDDSPNWSGFIGFCTLTSESQTPTWSNEVRGYMICAKSDSIEFQRYSPGQEIVEIAQTRVMSPNNWHRVKIDTSKNGEHKITSLEIDGTHILTYDDSLGEKQLDEGYFTLLCYGGTHVKLRAVEPTIVQGEGPAEVASGTIVLKTGSNKALIGSDVRIIDRDNAQVVPFTDSDRTLVPVRFLAETLDAYVTYDEQYCKVTLAFDEVNLEFTEGFAEYKENDDWKVSDCKAQVVQDRMFVPARVIAEAVGKTVDYRDGYIFLSDEPLSEKEENQLMSALRE